MENTGKKFSDRTEAGRQLAGLLMTYKGEPSTVILALPRGGVPVAFEVARRLKKSLDVFIVRKLGFPGQPELAMGALASGGFRYLNHDLVSDLRVSPEVIERVVVEQSQELERREKLYREGAPSLEIKDRTVILIDDGLATGATMKCAVMAVRSHSPKKIVVAVPVSSQDAAKNIRSEVDDSVTLLMPEEFHSVGQWYEDFRQTSDEEVRELLGWDK